MTSAALSWRIAATGIGGLFIGAVVGAATGQHTTTVVKTVVHVVHEQAATTTATVEGPVRYRTRVKTVRVPAQPQAATPTPPSSGRFFSGNGLKNLGTIVVDRDSTLKWTNSGELFSLFDDDADIAISSQRHSGESALAAGAYQDVSVGALGDWTVRIVG